MKLEKIKINNILLFSCLFAFLLFIDRLTKIFFIKNPEVVRDFWFMSFEFSFNKNIAFSLPLPQWLIIVLVLSILYFLLSLLVTNYQAKQRRMIMILSLIIIGAASNLFDRLRFGGVIDFIDVPYFTVFNLSDTYVFIGVCWWLCLEYKK